MQIQQADFVGKNFLQTICSPGVILTNGLVAFCKRCTVTRELYQVTLTKDEVRKWKKQGKLLQQVVPNMQRDQRVFLLTGLTPDEFRKSGRVLPGG